MRIWIIEFELNGDGRWIPASHPYYSQNIALKALKRHPTTDTRRHRVASYVREPEATA